MKRVQASLVLSRRRAKRRHYDQALKRHLVELTLVPGASVARIALDHRLNANILFRWRRHYLRELEGAGQQPAGALLPVRVSETEGAREVISEQAPSVRGRVKRQLGPSGVIEIELAGAQVRISGSVALDALRLVLQTLSDK
jgi:transposase